MGRYSLEENWEILKTFFQSGESSTQTVRNLAKKMDRQKVPSVQFVQQFVKRVRETGSLVDKQKRQRSFPARSTENIATVAESVSENPSTSTRRRSQELNIPRTTLRRILQKDLAMKRGGNQRDLARQKAQKKLADLNKGKRNDNLTVEQRKQRDAELMREKQKKKEEEAAAKAGGGGAK